METAAQIKRILIVEDEELLSGLLKWRLELEGYEVLTAAEGKKALIAAAESRPDLVMLDLRLPDIHGYQVCQELRKHFHPWKMPILMLTALDRPTDQLRGFAFGADAYLTKPFGMNELLQTIKLLFGESSFSD